MEKQTKITRKENHDSMWIKAQFPSGANFKFSIGRAGERLALAFSNDRKELKKQTKIFMDWLEYREGENNSQRFDRVEKLCKNCKSGGQVIKAIELETAIIS